MNLPRPTQPQVIVATAVMLLAGLGFSAAAARYKLYLTKDAVYPADGRLLMALPRETTNWVAVGPDRRENADTEKTLGTTNYVSRLYKRVNSSNSSPVILDFHAAYYTGMIDTVPHVPDRCFVGGGMQIGNIVGDLPLPLDQGAWIPVKGFTGDLAGGVFEIRTPNYSDRPGRYVTLPKRPQDIRLRTMQFLDKGGTPFYSGYFFIANGGVVSRSEGVRLLAFDLKTKYAYYCKLQVTSRTVTDGEDLARQAASLLDELLPDIMLCLPDWRELEREPAHTAAKDSTNSQGS